MIADTRAGFDLVSANRSLRSAPTATAVARTGVLFAAQIGVLWFINYGASAIVARLHVPVPGNVVGLTLLFALLCSGVVKATWLEPAATLLVKHLAFFFIPITIGLLDMGRLFALRGIGIIVTLAVSAAVGMAICGLITQCLINAQKPDKAGRGSEPNT